MAEAVIGRWGKSLAVRLPADAVRSARLAEGERVEVSVENGAVVLRPTLTEAERRDMAAAAEELLREGRGVSFGGLSIREMIEEGRR